MQIGKRFVDKELNVNAVVKSKRNNNGDYICEIINDRYNSRNGETFEAHESYIKTCYEILGDDNLELINNDFFCGYCNLPCIITCTDDSIGQTEFWGVILYDNHFSLNSDCCKSSIFKDVNLIEEYDQDELEELYKSRRVIEG